METPALGPRLRAIADLVPQNCQVLADVGTDHGYIPTALLLEGRVRQAVACDVGEAPLDRARRTAARFGVEDRIDFRLGDGLAVLAPGEADTIIIAGMGGDNIAGILFRAPWSRDGELLVLQPMSRAEVLRRWLPENGYAVEAEKLVLDKGVVYPILTVRGGMMPLAAEAQAWGGFLLDEDPLWGYYLENRILRLRKAADGLSRARDPALEEKRQSIRRVINELEQKKGAWDRANSARDRKRPL